MFCEAYKSISGSYAQKVNVLMRHFGQSEIGDQKAHYDYTGFCKKKRTDIALRGLEEIRSKLNGVCEPSVIEAYFVMGNILVMRGGYNSAVDRFNLIAVSAAIWILDQLSLQGNLEACYPFLPILSDDDPLYGVVPYIKHPMYDEQLILSMVRLIRQRNTSKEFSDPTQGAIVWEQKTPDHDDASKQNRRNFESVIQLLDKHAIKHAAEKYEADIWKFYRICFQIFECLEKHAKKLNAELEDLERKEVGAFNPSNVLLVRPKADISDVLKNTNMSGVRDPRAESIRREIDMLERFTLTELSLVNDREKSVKRIKDIVPEKLAEELIRFHVDDPFESAFALLYLLDTQSDLPWFYYGSISVAYTLCDQLPYDAQIPESENPILLSDLNNTLYEHRYAGYRWPERNDASGEPVQRKHANNLSQLLYSNTTALVPRVVPECVMLDGFLEALGTLSNAEREAYSLLLYSLRAVALRAPSIDKFRLEEEFKDGDIPETIIPTPNVDLSKDVSRLSKDLQQLREKNDRLIDALRESLLQSRTEHKRSEALAEALERQNKELYDLREKVFLLTQQEEPTDVVDEEICYPVNLQSKIISFGGHASWINEMKKKLPDVVFISPNTLPNVDLIRGADEIWIQTNCIAHSDYYKIMDVLKRTQKRVRYFVHAGANKCAEQIVNDHK